MKSRSQLAIEALDEVASRMERKWGVGRLPRLVAVDLAQRFYSQLGKLNAAIADEATGGSVANVEFEAGRMVNAWMALDAAAEAVQADRASGRCMGSRISDGRLLVVCEDMEAIGVWRRQNAEQGAAVWTIDEVVAVLEGFDLVNRTKHLFDGAVVEEVRVKPEVNWKRGDEVPDDMRAQWLAAG